MENRIEKIVIVGGGTAGWFSALYLDSILNSPEKKVCQITLLESKAVGIIGVGEATVRSMVDFLDFLGIDEYDFLVNCDASFKLGIKFVNWEKGNNEAYYHPFFKKLPQVGSFEIFDIWLQKKLKGEKIDDYAYFYDINSYLMDLHKSPKLFQDKTMFKGASTYAYHLNTDLLGKYLAKVGKQRGIKHFVDSIGVTNTEQDQNGFITGVNTSENGLLEGDFFIDCTGFRGVLINQLYKEPFISYNDSLLCESAVAVRLPEETYPNGMPSYTKATAMKNGWTWDIPLYSRRGIGYVYSSNFISKEEAERELMEEYLGMQVGDLQPNHIKMRVGKTRNTWVKNCVAVGLSGGFIEPLESTGIYLIQVGLENLFYSFPDKNFNQKVIDNYNRSMTRIYDYIKEFIVMHYCTTKREDTEFWKAAKFGLKIPEQLQNGLELYKQNRLSFLLYYSYYDKIFRHESYLLVLAGMNYLPENSMPLLAFEDINKYNAEAAKLIKNTIRNKELIKQLPDHYQYLATLHKSYQEFLSKKNPG